MYDIMALEHKALRELSDAELAADPLLVLACDHAFPRSLLDGVVALWDAYERDDSGAWVAPRPLQVSRFAKGSVT